MNRTILITGASSGIGKATALLFSENGWNVIATMRNPAEAKYFEGIQNIFTVPLDVESSQSSSDAIEKGVEKFGQIDLLVNNAGYAQYGVFESFSEDKIIRQFEVNVFGTMRVTKSILPVFRKQGRGMIINVTSGSGRFAVPLMSLYNASKFALEGFSESVSYELASQNISVKIIEPGSTASNFHHTLEQSTMGNHTPESYTDYVARLNAVMENVRQNTAAATSSPKDIAAAIYKAATDGSDQLRYIAGNDIQSVIDLRTSASEEEYMDFMKVLFNTNT